MKLFDFQTHKETFLNPSDMVCKHHPRQHEEISYVPAHRDPKRSNFRREVIRQPLPTPNSKVAISHM